MSKTRLGLPVYLVQYVPVSLDTRKIVIKAINNLTAQVICSSVVGRRAVQPRQTNVGSFSGYSSAEDQHHTYHSHSPSDEEAVSISGLDQLSYYWR